MARRGSEHQGDAPMKFFVRTIGPALLGLAFASAAFADGIELTAPYPGGYLWYQFTDEGNNAYNLPVAPYTSTTTIGGDTVSSYLICLDINNPTNVNTFYSGTFYTAETISEVPGQASLDTNKAVSWLADNLAGITPNDPAHAANAGPISLAIWQIEFATSNNHEGGADPIDPAAAAWITEATDAVNAGYQPDSVFFIPVDTTSQRFVAISETSTPGTLGLLPAPEPGTIGMMGTGLLGLAGLLRRKLQR
jgi:PEP-CTERM motif